MTFAESYNHITGQGSGSFMKKNIDKIIFATFLPAGGGCYVKGDIKLIVIFDQYICISLKQKFQNSIF